MRKEIRRGEIPPPEPTDETVIIADIIFELGNTFPALISDTEAENHEEQPSSPFFPDQENPGTMQDEPHAPQPGIPSETKQE